LIELVHLLPSKEAVRIPNSTGKKVKRNFALEMPGEMNAVDH
jgi:hypothetical protein